MEVITVIILILLLPTIQEPIHWLILVGIRVGVYKFAVDDGVSLVLP